MSARPVVVDGFRQGWSIAGLGTEPVTVVARFTPSTWVRASAWLSTATLPALFVVAGARRLRRRDDRAV